MVEASWGLGEGVVRGPDEYVVDKEKLTVAEKRISVEKVAWLETSLDLQKS